MESEPGNHRSPRRPPVWSRGLFPPFSTDWLPSASAWLPHVPNRAYGFRAACLSSTDISDSSGQCTTSKFAREEADGTRSMLVPVLVQLSWVGKRWSQEAALACPFWNPQQHACQLLSLFIITLLWIWLVCWEYLPWIYQAWYSILRIQKRVIHGPYLHALMVQWGDKA